MLVCWFWAERAFAPFFGLIAKCILRVKTANQLERSGACVNFRKRPPPYSSRMFYPCEACCLGARLRVVVVLFMIRRQAPARAQDIGNAVVWCWLS